jgi:hypothetical protein
MIGMEAGEHGGDEPRRQAGQASDPQPSGERAGHAGGLLADRLCVREDAARVHDNVDPDVRERHRASAPCEQPNAELLLQARHGAAHARLAHLEPLTGEREPAGVHDGHQHLELCLRH